jgi:hypothetical protein
LVLAGLMVAWFLRRYKIRQLKLSLSYNQWQIIPLIVLSLFLFSSCANRSYDINSLEEQFNSWIGREVPERTNNPKYWKPIKNTDDEIELEQKRPDGCAYSILFDRKTRIVKSWRYTSDRSFCDKVIGMPNV